MMQSLSIIGAEREMTSGPGEPMGEPILALIKGTSPMRLYKSSMTSYYIAPVILSDRSSGEWAISPRRSLDIIDPRCRARMALDDEAILNLPPVLFASQDGVQHDHPDDNASETTLKSDSSSGAGHVSRRKLMPEDLHHKASHSKISMEEKKNSALWCSASKTPRSHTLNFQPASRVARANGV